MTGKWLQFHSACTSDLADMGPGTFFRRVIIEGQHGDNMLERTNAKLILAKPSAIRKVIFCTGQVILRSLSHLVAIYYIILFQIYYHLYHKRSAHQIIDTTFVRLEQIGPFPFDMIAAAIMKFPNAELVWAQEEPRNMGAWSYIKPRFDTVIRDRNFPHKAIRYASAEC